MSVTLKLATSLDGRIATASGESRWITGPQAREQVHRLRAAHQAVLIGVETAIADDPELTVRLEGHDGPQPIRVVLDSRQRLPRDGRLVGDALARPTVVITTTEPHADLVQAGVTVIRTPDVDGRVDPAVALTALELHCHVHDILIEGGGQIAASFLAAGLVDRIEWFRAPILLGAEGRAAIGGLALNRLADAPRFVRVSVEALGDDLWERYEKR